MATLVGVWLWWRPTRGPGPEPAEAPRSEVTVEPPPAQPKTDRLAFEDVADELGVRFEYFRGDTGQLWTMEPHGGGVTCLDFNGDSLPDLFFVNGKQLPPEDSDTSHLGSLYRHQPAGGFEPVTSESELASNLYGQGCSSADYDNDGFPDLLVTGWQRCELWHNNGDGTFQDRTASAQLAYGKWNTGGCFADFDRDGNLDLFIANYLDFDPATHKPCMSKELRVGYCGPHHYAALDDFLLQGEGDGSFRDISQSAGILLPRGPGFGGVAADVDNDGWPDLLVANDAEANFMLHNQGSQGESAQILFRDMAMEWGIALNSDGLPEANMGIACGDFDGNGLLDFAISHFYQEHLTLYQNFGPKGFMDVTQRMGLDYTTRSKMGWGTGFVDFDHDGWPDLFVVNGHINNHEEYGMPYRMTAQIFQNDRGQRFADVSSEAGGYFQVPRIGRGTSVGDMDEDGMPDLVVVHHHEPTAILANRTASANNFLVLRLIGRSSNRDATNTRATVTLEGGDGGDPARTLVRECVAGEGYLGSNDKRLWVGVGRRQHVSRLELRWPSGKVDQFTDLGTDREFLIIEGRAPREMRSYGPVRRRSGEPRD